MRPNGMTTLASVGPFRDAGDLLAGISADRLLTCDRGHVAIAWSDWDARDCPVCGRAGVLSDVVAAAYEQAVAAAREDAWTAADEAENDLERLRGKVRDALMALEHAAETDNATTRAQLIDTAWRELDAAL